MMKGNIIKAEAYFSAASAYCNASSNCTTDNLWLFDHYFCKMLRLSPSSILFPSPSGSKIFSSLMSLSTVSKVSVKSPRTSIYRLFNTSVMGEVELNPLGPFLECLSPPISTSFGTETGDGSAEHEIHSFE
jgi:hypothetical protein